MRLVLASLAAFVVVAGFAAPKPDTTLAEVDALLAPLHVTPREGAEFTAFCDALVAKAEAIKTGLETDRRPAGADTFLRFDALYDVIQTGQLQTDLAAETNPDKSVREAAEACRARLGDLDTAVSLSRPIYDRLAAIDAGKLDARTAFVLKRRLASYRRAGVDRDEATRVKIAALQKQDLANSIAFNRNIREGRNVEKFRPEELAGLPADFMAAHKPGADGLIEISTDYTDFFPVMDFADNPQTRRRMQFAFENRAWPVNEAVFKALLQTRYEMATTLGYPNYAALALDNKMMGTPVKAAKFITDMHDAAKPIADRETAELLARKRKIDPAATQVDRWDASYLARLVRKESYDLDSEEVRGYFTYGRTRDGVLGVAAELFDVQFRPWKTPVWSEGVQAYEVVDKGKVIGRFFLDMHPRENKYGHAAAFPIRIGIEGRSLPVGALVCNFPATGPMDHEDVQTFFHELGHLMHWMLNGRHPLAQQNFSTVEWDFVEAPSQMLEEWTWDYGVLRRFAANAKGEPIPESLVKRMNTARTFGEASGAKQQINLSALSLGFYDRDPALIEPADFLKQNYTRYGNYPFMDGSHLYAAFAHLDNYSAYYYTYPWSKAIALDLFSQFQTAGLFDRATAARYRREVLEPGGSRPAAESIEAFLGRPFSLEPFERRIQGQ